MIRINIITVGKLKEKYWKDAVAEYSKRLSAFCNLDIIELSEYRLNDNPSEKEISQCLEAEAEKIITYCNQKGAYNIAMCIEGNEITSPKLAQLLNTTACNGFSIINFIIGSSFGIADRLKKSADFKLSMSPMTFPHQLARVLLLEQIYRGFQINNHSKYHK